MPKEFASEAEYFDKVGLKVLPAEVVHIVFRCKLLLAAKSEQEFNQQSGHVSIFANRALFPIWTDKGMRFDQLEDKYVSGLETDIRERTLLSHTSSLNPDTLKPGSQQAFFEDLFSSLGLPFVGFFDEDLLKKHTQYEPGLKSYDSATAKKFFSAPSLGFKITGTNNYCFVRGSIWLRTFLNMMRIAAFIYPGQMEFNIGNQMEPPTFPVIMHMARFNGTRIRKNLGRNFQTDVSPVRGAFVVCLTCGSTLGIARQLRNSCWHIKLFLSA